MSPVSVWEQQEVGEIHNIVVDVFSELFQGVDQIMSPVDRAAQDEAPIDPKDIVWVTDASSPAAATDKPIALASKLILQGISANWAKSNRASLRAALIDMMQLMDDEDLFLTSISHLSMVARRRLMAQMGLLLSGDSAEDVFDDSSDSLDAVDRRDHGGVFGTRKNTEASQQIGDYVVDFHPKLEFGYNPIQHPVNGKKSAPYSAPTAPANKGLWQLDPFPPNARGLQAQDPAQGQTTLSQNTRIDFVVGLDFTDRAQLAESKLKLLAGGSQFIIGAFLISLDYELEQRGRQPIGLTAEFVSFGKVRTVKGNVTEGVSTMDAEMQKYKVFGIGF